MTRPLNIHYFQHVAFEGLHSIEDWIKDNNHKLSSTKFYLDEKLPEIEDIDWLIVMGGPMGVYDEDKYAWLKAEKEFIAQAIDQNKTVLGICLGSQLIAEVCGAKVYPNKQKEIGWFPIQLTDSGRDNFLFKGLPEDLTVFHWHGDTFDLPRDAVRIAETGITKNQAFLINDKVLGLQFHMEVTGKSIADMLIHCKSDIVPGDSVQTAEKISEMRKYFNENNRLLDQLLNALAELTVK
ncbi:MAG TPA: amidotransferase [Sphingobacteriaceae bacterium]|nr:amidotransferase [Sphingobacteriaceae bacterium]